MPTSVNDTLDTCLAENLPFNVALIPETTGTLKDYFPGPLDIGCFVAGITLDETQVVGQDPSGNKLEIDIDTINGVKILRGPELVKRDLLWCFIELLQFNLHLRDGEVVQLNGVNIQVVREELRWHDPNGPGRVFPLTTIKRVEILEQTSKPKDETVP